MCILVFGSWCCILHVFRHLAAWCPGLSVFSESTPSELKLCRGLTSLPPLHPIRITRQHTCVQLGYNPDETTTTVCP